MKNLFNIIICLFGINSFAQIIVGDVNNTSTNKTSVLMDFERTNNRGILLPSVNSTTTISTAGTLVLDATTPSSSEFKLKKNGTSWFSYSRNNGNASAITSNRPSINDYSTAKVVVGADTSTVDGALVLESTTKAMVLPVVSSLNNIANPSPGMMVFLDKNTCTNYSTPCEDKFLAFFNGTEWSIWGYSL